MERYSMFLGRKNQYHEHDSIPNAIYRLNMIPIKLRNGIFHRTRTKNFTIHMETQKTLNSQSSLEKEKWSWRNQTSWLQIILQSYSHQNSMILAQKQKCRPMEQDRKPGNKPMHLRVPYFLTKEARIHNEAKTASSINAAGKTGQLHAKEWN